MFWDVSNSLMNENVSVKKKCSDYFENEINITERNIVDMH